MSLHYNRHSMIVDFKGNPGLDDYNSLYRQSLAELCSRMYKCSIRTDLYIGTAAPHGDARLTVQFACQAGLDMPGRMQRFVEDSKAQARVTVPQNSIKHIDFTHNFPQI